MPVPQKSILPATWEVPAEFRSRLGEKAGRQRAMMAEGHLLLVLHAPPKKDEPDRKGRLQSIRIQDLNPDQCGALQNGRASAPLVR